MPSAAYLCLAMSPSLVSMVTPVVSSTLSADGHGSLVRAIVAVAGLVDEGDRAGKAGVWRVGEGAVGIEVQRAVCRAGDLDRRERVVVRICVVGEHAGSIYRKVRVLIRGVGVGLRRRRGVATACPFRGVTTKEGSRWRARSTNSRTDS